MRKEEEKKESDKAEKVRQEAADWDKERERGRRKRAVYHSLMALVESRVQALSLASVTAETAAHISSSPGESRAPPGEKNEEE